MKGFFAVLPMLALAACVTGEPPVTDTDDACRASAMQSLIGQPESVLAAMTFAEPARILHPGDAVTMDFSAERLNILIGTGGRIEQVYCG